MNHIFISGMGRSGTTLLDKLLSNHSDIDILSQPLPLVFIEAKKRFLHERGSDQYYVLNDDFINRSYTQEEFDSYLKSFTITEHDIKEVFNTMKTYSGQCTKPIQNISFTSHSLHSYQEVMNKCLNFFDVDNDAKYVGIKEPMCEEFLPYLNEHGYKTIVVVRDPRDVLASANYPKKRKYLGSKKPALFILRTWRKSAEYIYSLKNNKNFHFLRYEDLVNHTYQELDKITDFLELHRFSPTTFNKGILDRNGDPWLANTSFENAENFISNQSIGIYKNTLNDEEIKYTEAICSHEMQQLGYHFNHSHHTNEILRSYKDTDVEDSTDIKANYSSQENNINKEIERLTGIKKSLYAS